jgi:SAM-dependent methyltransferase
MSSSASPRRQLFQRPADYDRLRADNDTELFDRIVEEAELRGRRVLDIGCGTGTFLVHLEPIAKAWGVEPSPEMREAARAKGVNAKDARAEALPFKDGWFERATMNSVVHLLDTTRAFPEARRVLAGDGKLAVRTLHPTWFDEYWLFAFFPSIRDIDLARFKTPDELERELLASGFTAVRQVPIFFPASLTRERVLERTRGRHISTFDHISEEEFEAGLARMERELPETVRYERRFHLVVADC